MVSMVLYTVLIGMQILGISDDLPLAWINAFKEYPYLYKGSLEEGRHYFEHFAAHGQGSVVIATVDGKFAGFLTGAPLIAVNDHFKGITDVFRNSNLDPNNFYYFSDVVVLPEFQNKGVAKKFFQILEEKAKKSWGYKNICLVTIEHDAKHPLRPSDYEEADARWEHLGFTKTPMKIKHIWSTIIDENGNAEDQENVLVLWTK
jgi:GNAT superfamily N-acetyltransferase